MGLRVPSLAVTALQVSDSFGVSDILLIGATNLG